MASDTGHEARRASGVGPTAGRGYGHARVSLAVPHLAEGVDQVRHPLLVGHRPVEMLRLEQAVQSVGNTEFLVIDLLDAYDQPKPAVTRPELGQEFGSRRRVQFLISSSR